MYIVLEFFLVYNARRSPTQASHKGSNQLIETRLVDDKSMHELILY